MQSSTFYAIFYACEARPPNIVLTCEAQWRDSCRAARNRNAKARIVTMPSQGEAIVRSFFLIHLSLYFLYLLTVEIDGNYDSICRCCRKNLVGSVVQVGKTVTVWGKNRIRRKTQNPEMKVPISFPA